jgi:hypothetical protein
MNIIRKDATITNTGAGDDFPGAFEVILSAPTKDRDGDTLLADEWKQPLPEHITFDSDHGMSVATTVGSGVPELNDAGQLIVKGTYSSLPRAQEVRTLVNEGHIRTTSVAFMTEQSGKGAGRKAVRELLNGAFVAVPSNREALVLSSKGVDSKAGARNSKADAALIQTIVQAALALGVDVPEEKHAATGTMKSIVGSVEALRDRVQAALREANDGAWVWIRGTIPGADGAGVVVFEVEDRETYESALLRQSYTDNGTTATLTGDAAAVGVMEVLTPDPDEESEASDSTAGSQDAPAAGEKSPSAGAETAPVTDEAAAIQMQAARIRAMKQIASASNSERS